MLENLLFEFTPALEQTKSSLNKIKQIGIDKSVSLSNESLITIGEFGFIENRSPIVKRDLDRCDLSACDGKEPEKPMVPEDFGPKRPRLSSRIIMNINSPISQSEMDSINFSLDNEGLPS